MLNIATGAAERNPLRHDRPEIGDVAGLPVGFDPSAFPILSQHWFGKCPASVAALNIANARYLPPPLSTPAAGPLR